MHVHATHVFANLMYFLSDALGFWPKGRKSEMRYRTKYDSHRKHFAEYGVEEVTLNKLTANSTSKCNSRLKIRLLSEVRQKPPVAV